ncbi:MAG: right-handed parallel beta-helix repeat-containing protein [Elusimicrobia bacterium]|nr:right-handed parallel beta-helix repeat-containing protein [Elusimicrobiota bacterium]
MPSKNIKIETMKKTVYTLLICAVAGVALSAVFKSCGRRRSGSIAKNTVWKGKIKLTGDIVVERRASLTIEAGTRIYYAGKADNQVRYIREEAAGSFNILQNDKIEILVEGRLNIRGDSKKPVKFMESPAFGGIVLLGNNPAAISFAEFTGGDVPIRVYGENNLILSDSVIRDAALAGVGYWDLAAGKITNCVFENCRHAIGVADFASPGISSSSVRFSKMAGIFCEGNSAPVITNCKIEGNNAGIACGGISKPEIRSCSVIGNGAGISLWSKASAIIDGCRVMKNVSGVLFQDESSGKIKGSVLRSNGCAVSAAASSRPVIKANVFTGNDVAVILRDNAVSSINDNTITGKEGIRMSELSRSRITGNSFSDCETAVKLMNRSRAVLRSNKMSSVKNTLVDERVK